MMWEVLFGCLALGALGILLIWKVQASTLHTLSAHINRNWRGVLARLPLPMLALAASYGVYSFAALFVPQWVAVVQAAAFELTYIGLAVVQGLDSAGRRRATSISVGAVITSVLYNTLAGWFHRQPQLLASASPEAWLCFAILHGAPLAWVAYLVADLLLHTSPVNTAPTMQLARIAADIPPQPVYAPPTAVYAPEQPAEPDVCNDADMLATMLAADADMLAPEQEELQPAADMLATMYADMPAEMQPVMEDLASTCEQFVTAIEAGYEGDEPPPMQLCSCGCKRPLSASEIAGRRKTKRGHKEVT